MKTNQRHKIRLRLKPSIDAVINRNAVVILTAVVVGGLVLAFVFGLSSNDVPDRADDPVFSLPKEFQLPDALTTLPADYAATRAVEPVPQPQPIVPQAVTSTSDQTIQALAELSQKIAQISSQSQSMSNRISRDMEQKINQLTKKMDSSIASIRNETNQVIEQLKQRKPPPPPPAKVKSQPSDAIVQQVNASPILFSLSGRSPASENKQEAQAVLSDKVKNPVQAGQNQTSSAPTEFAVSSTYLGDEEIEKLGHYVRSGTFIPAILISAIDSSLPGGVVAQVRENIFDTESGQYLLLPQGSKIIGSYASLTGPAVKRINIKFTHIVRPDGLSIALETDHSGVTDQMGISGIAGEVDNHWGQVALVTLLSAALNIGVNSITDVTTISSDQGGINIDTDSGTLTYSQAQGISSALGQGVNLLAERLVPAGPVVHIDPGQTFNILVHQDMKLPAYELWRG